MISLTKESKNLGNNTILDQYKVLLKQIIAYCPAMSYILQDKTTYLPWLDIFSELNDNQIRIGLKWLKSNYKDRDISPGRFKFKCFGLYDPKIAYELAVKREWKHPIIYWSAIDSGMHNARIRCSADNELTKFIRIYELKCNEVLAGKIYSIPEELEPPKCKPVKEKTAEEKEKSKEIQREVMAKIRQRLGKKTGKVKINTIT